MKRRPRDFADSRAIRLIFGESADETATMLEDLGIYAVLSYLQEEKVVIPLIGEVTFHRGDSGIWYEFEPSQFLVQNIGKIENGREAEFEGMLARRFKDVLEPKEKPMKCAQPKSAKAETVPEAQDGLFQSTAVG